ncbi:MAG TPA: beta-propeller domain-containing protein, partial [Candidatus Binatia bacterium]|nr:beta-propeller domain-containing protein [Candidatus Binatia bacterium]
NPATWEWGTQVASFDLADPAAPVSRGTLFYSGYAYDVAATERYFAIIGQTPTNWWQSIVHLVDISAPDGAMQRVTSVTPVGRVPDKFKLDVNGTVLTIISQVQNPPATVLETFSLEDSDTPAKLGELTVGTTEQLHATRFDGDRVYIVTFHVQNQIDPLWIVDLSDPVHPAVRGELEIPGWSTFLQPLGNRLVALGIETNRTTVSLFDVAVPAKPSMLSRVMLGSGWSWSEGNWDEKAFNVLSDAGLILVPFQSWNTNRYVQQVQLIDLGSNSLALRGVIDHQFQPRRATLFHDRILSVSAQELLSVDATDRDHPEVRAKLDLAWPVDRVFVHGNHLLEISGGSHSWGWWFVPAQPNAVIRVTSTEAPDNALTSFALSNALPIIGATKQGNYLYIAQSPAMWYYPPIYIANSGTGAITNPPTPFHLTILNLDNLPQLSVAGEIEVNTEAPSWGSDLQALWVKPGTLVWVGGGFDFWFRCLGCPVAVDAGPARASAPWFWPSTGGQLLAFDVSHSDAPAFASEVSLINSNNNWWSFSKAFTAEGLIYLSHQTSEFVIGLDVPWANRAYTNIVYNQTTGQSETNIYPAGAWVQRNFLDVVDYADAKNPTVRQPVNISGELQGISHQGALLYTVSSEWHWETNSSGSRYTQWTQKLDALAYDGVAAHLVDSLALASSWPRPIDVVGNNVFLGRSGYDYSTTNRYPHYLEVWTVPNTGKFTQLGRLTLENPAQDLRDYPGMLAVQQSDQTILLIDLANPASLSVIGRDRPAGCLWWF